MSTQRLSMYVATVSSTNILTKIVEALFLKASVLTGDEFIGRLKYYASAWLPARDVVKEALLSRGTHHPDKRVLVFECSVPWKVNVLSTMALLFYCSRHLSPSTYVCV